MKSLKRQIAKAKFGLFPFLIYTNIKIQFFGELSISIKNMIFINFLLKIQRAFQQHYFVFCFLGRKEKLELELLLPSLSIVEEAHFKKGGLRENIKGFFYRFPGTVRKIFAVGIQKIRPLNLRLG